MNTKKIFNNTSKAFWIVGMILLGVTGCKEDFLKPDPLSFFEPDATFTTQSGLDAQMAICDRHLRAYWTYTRLEDLGRPMSVEYMLTDVAVAGKTDASDILADVATRVTPTTLPERMSFFWGETYNGIKYANTILAYVDRVQGLDDAAKNVYRGRALFHRSVRYLSLCFHFKDVPLITKLLQSPKTDYRTTKREAILEMITSDMEKAVQWVPDQSQMSLTGLVNKGACRQLLIKCYLATGQWDKAIEQADILINNSGYSLMTQNFGTFISPYSEVWPVTRNVIWDLHRPENKAISANKEGILVMINRNETDMGIKMEAIRNWGPMLDNTANLTPDGKAAVLFAAKTNADYRASLDYNRALGRGIGIIRPTYYAEKGVWFLNGVNDEGDLRHSTAAGNWVTMESLKYNNPKSTYFGQNLRLKNSAGNFLIGDTIRNWFGYPHYKYYIEDPVATRDPGNKDHRGGAGDWYFYRLAETYLLRAEAKFYKGDIAGATEDVNTIRRRAKCTQLYSSVTIGDIMSERARELHMEEWRFTEMSRVSYCLALSGKSDEWGNTYNANTLDQNSYWYQRIQHYNNYYNKGQVIVQNRSYTMAPHNINWPIPQGDIDANGGARLRQNPGYTGFDAGIPMWDTWQEAVADEDKK